MNAASTGRLGSTPFHNGVPPYAVAVAVADAASVGTDAGSIRHGVGTDAGSIRHDTHFSCN